MKSSLTDDNSIFNRSLNSSWFLVFLAFCIPLLRLRYFEEPLDNDIPIRLAYARRALDGAQYYSDLFVFGPAGGLWYNEVFASLFGVSHFGVYIMGSMLAVTGLWAVWCTAHLLGGRVAASLSAICWFVMCGDLLTQANQPNSESYMNALLAWGLYFAVKSVLKGLTRTEQVLLGLLVFLASSAKHFVVIIPIMGLVGLYLNWVLGKKSGQNNRSFGEFFSPWWPVMLTVFLLWLTTAAGYFATGRLDAFMHGVLGESAKYAGGGSGGLAYNFVKALYPKYLMPSFLKPFSLLFVASAAAVIYFARGARRASLSWLLGGWLCGTWLAVAFPGKFFPHYYQLWMPIVAVCVAYFWLMCSPSHRDSRFGRVGIVAVLALLVLRLISVYWTTSPEDSVRLKYGGRGYLGELFSESKSLGEALRPLVRAGSSDVFEMGVYGVYFYTGTLAPTPFVDSLYAGTQPEQYVSEMGRFLRGHPPKYLLVSKGVMEGRPTEPLTMLKLQFMDLVRYAPVPSLSTGQIAVFVRSD